MDKKIQYCTSDFEGITLHHGCVSLNERVVTYSSRKGLDDLLAVINPSLIKWEFGFKVSATDIIPMPEESKRMFHQLA